MGDDLVIEIDEGDDDERADEDEDGGKGGRQTEFPEEEPGEDRRQELDQRIAEGDALPGSPGIFPPSSR